MATVKIDDEEQYDDEFDEQLEYDMTTIRRQRHSAQRKWFWAALVVVLLGMAAVLVFVKPLGGQNVRKSPSNAVPETDTDVAPQDKASSSGRDIIFEVTNLDGEEGSVDKFVVRTQPDWSPLGVEQFHKLIDAGFYNQCRFFRVVPNFIVQFGMNGDPQVQAKWRTPINDDPVLTTNARGTVTFATSGPNTRTTQLFINTNGNGNAFLDEQGFSPFAQVISGMEVVDRIYNGYGEQPSQALIKQTGNEYLVDNFPKLSFIVTASA